MIPKNTDFSGEILVNLGSASYLYYCCSTEGFLLCRISCVRYFLWPHFLQYLNCSKQQENPGIFGAAIDFMDFTDSTDFTDFTLKQE